MRFAASRRSSSESSTSSTMKESWPLIELQQTASLEEHLRNAMVRFLGNREPFEDGWFTFVNIAEQKVLEVSEALRDNYLASLPKQSRYGRFFKYGAPPSSFSSDTPRNDIQYTNQYLHSNFDLALYNMEQHRRRSEDSGSSSTLNFSSFKPTHLALANRGLVSPFRHGNLILHGTKYQGDVNSKSYRSQRYQMLDEENCSLWITGIPPSITYTDMFSVITTGAVFALYLIPPNEDHPLQGAKLVFMNPEAAAAFMASDITLNGKPIWKRYNRNGTPRNTNTYSRVLMIEGPAQIMRLQYWMSYFQQYCLFSLETVLAFPGPILGTVKMEFRFARVDGQAQCCLQAILADPSLKGVVKVYYGKDPCDPSFNGNC